MREDSRAESTRRRDFLVSIHPRFAETIFSGRKTVELRRRFSDSADTDSLVFIYCTSPVQSLVGTAQIVEVNRMPIGSIWRKYRKAACVSKAEFDSYFAGVDFGYAILLHRVKRFRTAIAADDLRREFGFVAPQSFRYVPREYYSLLDHARLQGSY
jgi:predicted transcriptional regulator